MARTFSLRLLLNFAFLAPIFFSNPSHAIPHENETEESFYDSHQTKSLDEWLKELAKKFKELNLSEEELTAYQLQRDAYKEELAAYEKEVRECEAQHKQAPPRPVAPVPPFKLPALSKSFKNAVIKSLLKTATHMKDFTKAQVAEIIKNTIKIDYKSSKHKEQTAHHNHAELLQTRLVGEYDSLLGDISALTLAQTTISDDEFLEEAHRLACAQVSGILHLQSILEAKFKEPIDENKINIYIGEKVSLINRQLPSNPHFQTAYALFIPTKSEKPFSWAHDLAATVSLIAIERDAARPNLDAEANEYGKTFVDKMEASLYRWYSAQSMELEEGSGIKRAAARAFWWTTKLVFRITIAGWFSGRTLPQELSHLAQTAGEMMPQNFVGKTIQHDAERVYDDGAKVFSKLGTAIQREGYLKTLKPTEVHPGKIDEAEINQGIDFHNICANELKAFWDLAYALKAGHSIKSISRVFFFSGPSGVGKTHATKFLRLQFEKIMGSVLQKGIIPFTNESTAEPQFQLTPELLIKENILRRLPDIAQHHKVPLIVIFDEAHLLAGKEGKHTNELFQQFIELMEKVKTSDLPLVLIFSGNSPEEIRHDFWRRCEHKAFGLPDFTLRKLYYTTNSKTHHFNFSDTDCERFALLSATETFSTLNDVVKKADEYNRSTSNNARITPDLFEKMLLSVKYKFRDNEPLLSREKHRLYAAYYVGQLAVHIDGLSPQEVQKFAQQQRCALASASPIRTEDLPQEKSKHPDHGNRYGFFDSYEISEKENKTKKGNNRTSSEILDSIQTALAGGISQQMMCGTTGERMRGDKEAILKDIEELVKVDPETITAELVSSHKTKALRYLNTVFHYLEPNSLFPQKLSSQKMEKNLKNAWALEALVEITKGSTTELQNECSLISKFATECQKNKSNTDVLTIDRNRLQSILTQLSTTQPDAVPAETVALLKTIVDELLDKHQSNLGKESTYTLKYAHALDYLERVVHKQIKPDTEKMNSALKQTQELIGALTPDQMLEHLKARKDRLAQAVTKLHSLVASVNSQKISVPANVLEKQFYKMQRRIVKTQIKHDRPIIERAMSQLYEEESQLHQQRKKDPQTVLHPVVIHAQTLLAFKQARKAAEAPGGLSDALKLAAEKVNTEPKSS